jgi:hypothetical protein
VELFGHRGQAVGRQADRYREHRRDGMLDRFSSPKSSPLRTPSRVERRVIGLRVSRRWGPARIAYLLRMAVSTVHKILRRFGCPLLVWPDSATGVRIKQDASPAESCSAPLGA